ncbi:alpha/beta hydrolase family protein [Paludisphaera mucosa]|uniref:Prolyl oligopeptidase family serine peptidase n=1 Tax=Paludisphaera mucosa TaxID=3030827 RepID=A0ABT6F6G6_9BACT|nr:prolyl oligopeptidase family serine peptidase [Paludisphaera mucosa]MDG3003181.1 prolyl oligopeptidase family serine peptidase [Paludisphaera mucosa]
MPFARRLRPLSLALFVWTTSTLAQEPAPMRAAPEMLVAPKARPAEGFQADGMSAVFYEGMPWKGKRTEVFAWVGVPALKPGEKAPGIVLVHGGGGTAFEAWVRLWTGRGYAAIAMDTCGTVPRGTYGKWERHESGGPPGNNFAEAMVTPEDQWPYHAVADVLLAHSLLRARPDVDPDSIGLTGISWGGYLTCIASGLDGRFRFAAPVYGCGFLGEASTWKAEIDKLGDTGRRWLALWDPSHYLPGGTMPKLWVTGTNDFAYPLDSLQKSYRAAGGESTLAVRLRMPHGHGGAGENPEEIHAFADSILKGGPSLARVGPLTRKGEGVEASYQGAASIVRAELLATKDGGPWTGRLWEAAEARIDPTARVASAKISDGVRAAFLNLYDDRGRVVSSEHLELPQTTPRSDGP